MDRQMEIRAEIKALKIVIKEMTPSPLRKLYKSRLRELRKERVIEHYKNPVTVWLVWGFLVAISIYFIINIFFGAKTTIIGGG